MRALGAPPAMQTVMGGKFAQQIICRTVNFRSEKEEDFYQVFPDHAASPSCESVRDCMAVGWKEVLLVQSCNTAGNL